ncbi:MAG: ATP-dependent DNA helicase, partial [Bacteroidia bacterium]|nr:ATP-dependent DNA helicase [Bacteroidia bacterium]
SYAVTRYTYGQMRYNSASRLLDEISFDNLEATHLIEGGMGSPGRAKIQGNFHIKKVERYTEPAIDPALFRPNHPSEIREGQRVLHLKFGEGKVENIDGGIQNRIATIIFEKVGAERKRIALKFAKLQILD